MPPWRSGSAQGRCAGGQQHRREFERREVAVDAQSAPWIALACGRAAGRAGPRQGEEYRSPRPVAVARGELFHGASLRSAGGGRVVAKQRSEPPRFVQPAAIGLARRDFFGDRNHDRRPRRQRRLAVGGEEAHDVFDSARAPAPAARCGSSVRGAAKRAVRAARGARRSRGSPRAPGIRGCSSQRARRRVVARGGAPVIRVDVMPEIDGEGLEFVAQGEQFLVRSFGVEK